MADAHSAQISISFLHLNPSASKIPSMCMQVKPPLCPCMYTFNICTKTELADQSFANEIVIGNVLIPGNGFLERFMW